jgi:hypothetical protein
MSNQNLIPSIFAPVTPSDTSPVNCKLGLYIGGAGNVVIEGANGVAATFIVSAGQYLTGCCRLVKASTTATGIVSLS